MSWQPRGADLEAHRFAMWVITHARSRESYEEAEVGVGGRWERVGAGLSLVSVWLPDPGWSTEPH